MTARFVQFRALLLSVYLFSLPAAWAAVDPGGLASLPILHEGRVKPLDTFARATLLQLSARSSFEGQDALHWMATVIFTPEAAREFKVFRINHPQISEALKIEPEPSPFRYSIQQLGPKMNRLYELAAAANEIDEKKRTPVESEMLRVYESVALYLSLTDCLNFAAPHEVYEVKEAATLQRLGLEPGQGMLSYLDARRAASVLATELTALETKPDSDWSASDREILQISRGLYTWSGRYQKEYNPLSLLPHQLHGDGNWLNPWQLVVFDFEGAIDTEIKHLEGMVLSYRAGDQEAFDEAVAGFRQGVEARGGLNDKLDVELRYNRLDLFYRAKLCYLFALLAVLFGALALKRLSYGCGWLLLGAGFLCHVAGIGLRMYISGRPPITNLFETFVFVGAVSVIIGFLLERFQRRGVGLFTGAVSALAMLLIASRYSAQGDTLNVLVAVLDSNFWLATHVVTINLGYAGCCVAGVIGHIYLVQAVMNPLDKVRLGESDRMIFGVLGFGLIFTFTGTVLGGIWADQSWGRFWGWDPKENGALLIVLWCAILLHARLGRMIGELGFAAGSIIGIIVVMMAWFGINLLGVGLHSYGFTSGVKRGLILYIFLESAFLAFTVPLVWRMMRRVAKTDDSVTTAVVAND